MSDDELKARRQSGQRGTLLITLDSGVGLAFGVLGSKLAIWASNLCIHADAQGDIKKAS